MDIKIAITNLGAYNEGRLLFEWLALPYTDDELSAALDTIGIDGEQYEEYFISDYEAPFSIDEYANIARLNDLIESYECLDDDQQLACRAYMDQYSDDIEKAIEFADGGDYTIIHDVIDMEGVAMYFVDNGYYTIKASDTLHNYIDYKRLGRDLSFESTFIFIDNHCVEFHI